MTKKAADQNPIVPTFVAGPHVKQPLADELSWVNMF